MTFDLEDERIRLRLLGAIVLVAAVLRFLAIGSWPVFIDEDIYAWNGSELAKLPWSRAFDVAPWGKSPFVLYAWGILGRVFGDALIAARLTGALAGTISTACTFLLARRIADERVGLVAAGLYAIAPLAVLHERMGLMDGPMAALALGSVLLGWKALDEKSWSAAAASFVAGFLAVQFKIPGVATAVAVPMLLWTYRGQIRERAVYAIPSAAGPVVSYYALMWSWLAPGFQEQNDALRGSTSLSQFLEHLQTLVDTVVTYMPAGLFLFAAAGAVLLLREKPRLAVVVLAVMGAWVTPWLVFSRFSPSRYDLPALPFACALAALAMIRAIELAARRHESGAIAAAGVCALVAAASALGSAKLVVAHSIATLSTQDDWQYRSGWPSGYGYPDALELIERTAPAGAAVAFVIDPRHRVAAGFLHPSQRLDWLGVVSPADNAALRRKGELFVVTDDNPEEDVGLRLARLRARQPHLALVETFEHPLGGKPRIYVLRASN